MENTTATDVMSLVEGFYFDSMSPLCVICCKIFVLHGRLGVNASRVWRLGILFSSHKFNVALFPLTVVIEDDRIDDVLKGMADKSSPGV